MPALKSAPSMLKALIGFFQPDVDSPSGRQQLTLLGELLTTLLALPVGIVGLLWLARVTSLGSIIQDWQVFALTLLFMAVFDRLGYFLIVEIRQDRYGSADGSLSSTAQWAGLFLSGPGMLWLSVGFITFYFLRNWLRAITRAQRLAGLRNLAVSLSRSTVVYLLAWQVYLKLGGRIPLAEFSLTTILVAMAAIGVDLLLELALVTPYTLVVIRANYLITKAWDADRIVKFLGLVIGLPVLAHPFAILAAGLYVQWGVGTYLFIMLGVVLVAYLARRLSWAAEYSRQQSRQLTKLEQLSRAILSSPPNLSTLQSILEEHVVSIFPTHRALIWVNDRVLLLHPNDWLPPVEAMHQWVCNQPQAQAFLWRDPLPWNEQRDYPGPYLITSIRESDDAQPSGGICLQLKNLDGPWDRRTLSSFFPALHSLADQVRSALRQIEIYQSTLEYNQLIQELTFAGKIQASFLPDEIPDLDDWEIAFTILPARETSGDFFDFIPMLNSRLGFVIADVADKGVGAALYMALCRTLIRTYALEYEENPGVVLFSANNRILQDARANLFVTAFYGVLDEENGTLTYCNAGHNPPYLLASANGGQVTALQATGMPVGIEEDNVWREEVITLSPGDVLVLYTDGIPDAMNGNGERFMDERLIQVIQSHGAQTAQELMAAILQEIQDYVGDAPPFDDITLLILKRD